MNGLMILKFKSCTPSVVDGTPSVVDGTKLLVDQFIKITEYFYLISLVKLKDLVIVKLIKVLIYY